MLQTVQLWFALVYDYIVDEPLYIQRKFYLELSRCTRHKTNAKTQDRTGFMYNNNDSKGRAGASRAGA